LKIGTFIMGGLAGAAIVMIMKKQSMASIGRFVNLLTNLRPNSASSNAGMQGLSLVFGNAGASSQPSQSGQQSGGIEQVKQLVAKDEQVKQEVNKILQQNNEPTI